MQWKCRVEKTCSENRANPRCHQQKKKDDDEAYTTKADKTGKEKDPNAPKRPQSAYFLFMNDRRPALQKEKPELKFGDLTKALTEDWKALSEKDRKKYEDMATKDKARYE